MFLVGIFGLERKHEGVGEGSVSVVEGGSGVTACGAEEVGEVTVCGAGEGIVYEEVEVTA